MSAAQPSSTGLRYIEQFIDAAGDVAESRIPSPPVRIAQPPEPVRQTVFDPSKPEDMAAMFQVQTTPYPEVWPFDGPLS